MNTSKPTTTTESKLSEQIEAVENKLNENSLAWEMLKEQKRTIKRLFTTIFVLIAFLFVIMAVLTIPSLPTWRKLTSVGG